MAADDRLLAALAVIQRHGAIGERSLSEAVAHADQFVRVLSDVAGTLVDLGSGGGLPGLVIAVRRPDLSITLVERRATRADLLRRAVVSLDLDDCVTVFAGDVRDIATTMAGTVDMVTARSFAAPEITAEWAGVLLRSGGMLVVSEPPTDDAGRWAPEILDRCGLVDEGRDQGVRRFSRR